LPLVGASQGWRTVGPQLIYHPDPLKDLPKYVELVNDDGGRIFLEVHRLPAVDGRWGRQEISLRSPFHLVNRTGHRLVVATVANKTHFVDDLKAKFDILTRGDNEGVMSKMASTRLNDLKATQVDTVGFKDGVRFVELSDQLSTLRASSLAYVTLPPGATMLLGCLDGSKLGVHLGIEDGGMSDPIWLQDLTFQDSVVNAHAKTGELCQLGMHSAEFYPPQDPLQSKLEGFTHSLQVIVDPHIVLSNVSGRELLLRQGAVDTQDSFRTVLHLGPGKFTPLVFPLADASTALQLCVKVSGDLGFRGRGRVRIQVHCIRGPCHPPQAGGGSVLLLILRLCFYIQSEGADRFH
jgi:hypothetical protein